MAKGFLLVCMSFFFFFLVPNVLMIAAIAIEKVETTGPMTPTSLPDHQTTSSSSTSKSVHNQNENHVRITRAAAAPVPLPPRAGGNNHQSSSKSAGLPVSPAPKPSPIRTDTNQKDLKSSSATSISPEHGTIPSTKPPSTATGEDHGVVSDTVEASHPHLETTPDENHGSEGAAAPQHGNDAHSEDEHHEAAESTETSGAESPLSNRKLANHHHYHPSDKSVAGGGVILGGLATTFVVSIACYIRATRRKNKNTNNKINNINDGENEPQESSPAGINTK